MFKRIAIASALTMVLVSGSALAAHHLSAVAKKASSASGEILTDAKGMSLYTFDKDTTGVSNCKGKCAVNWPPLAAAADAKGEGDFSVIKRDDGSNQWTYKGKPLYTWIKDKKPGDITGEGVRGVWHLARP